MWLSCAAHTSVCGSGYWILWPWSSQSRCHQWPSHNRCCPCHSGKPLPILPFITETTFSVQIEKEYTGSDSASSMLHHFVLLTQDFTGGQDSTESVGGNSNTQRRAYSNALKALTTMLHSLVLAASRSGDQMCHNHTRWGTSQGVWAERNVAEPKWNYQEYLEWNSFQRTNSGRKCA